MPNLEEGADLETRHLLPTPLGNAVEKDSEGNEGTSQERFERVTSSFRDFSLQRCCQCLLGPVFGWLGFSFLDTWWPQRHLSPAEWALYHRQQKHKKDLACIARAMTGIPVSPELLRSAMLSFAGSDQSVDLSFAELNAMFYFAGCHNDAKSAFLAFVRTLRSPTEMQGVSDRVALEDLLEAFARWPSHRSAVASAGA
ncbi:unnamed protein product [Durusdinium trenchii]|uniref:Transmembrane protein n=1 Tax=Durusdinium trenchii TaxID=1381693 RepID=A0ABP0NW76_9DINO